MTPGLSRLLVVLAVTLSFPESVRATIINLTFDVRDGVFTDITQPGDPSPHVAVEFSSPITPFTHIASLTPEPIIINLSFLNGPLVVTNHGPGGPGLNILGFLHAQDPTTNIFGSSTRFTRFPDGSVARVSGGEGGNSVLFGFFGNALGTIEFATLQFDNRTQLLRRGVPLSVPGEDVVFDRFTFRIVTNEILPYPLGPGPSVPEPTTLSLFGLALAVAARFTRRT